MPIRSNYDPGGHLALSFDDGGLERNEGLEGLSLFDVVEEGGGGEVALELHSRS